MTDRTYDYRALVQTYLETERNDVHPDVKVYYRKLLALLEQCFGIHLAQPPPAQGALWMLFRSTVHSYLSLRTPWSHFLEEGLIVRQLDDLGAQGQAIFQRSDQIAQLTKASREAHLQLLYDLFECIYGKQELVVTSHDLRAKGFDDAQKPDPTDYY
jgi:hypothetical protein